jgi:hypothetical protein
MAYLEGYLRIVKKLAKRAKQGEGLPKGYQKPTKGAK